MIVGFSDFQQEDRNQGEESTGDTAGKGLETGGQKSLQRVQRTRGGARAKSVLIYFRALPWSICIFHVKLIPCVRVFSLSLSLSGLYSG